MKVHDYAADYTKAKKDFLNTKTKLAKLAYQLKQKYDTKVAVLKKKLFALEKEMVQQIKYFKTEKENCYALIFQLEESVRQLQDQNNMDAQVLKDRTQQFGCLLQEKGIIKTRIKEIVDYVMMKYHEYEDITRYMFFATMMTFVRQVMDDLGRLQEDIAQRPAQ